MQEVSEKFVISVISSAAQVIQTRKKRQNLNSLYFFPLFFSIFFPLFSFHNWDRANVEWLEKRVGE